MNCTQKQQLVCFPKVRVYKPWFRHFNDHKDFRNEGTVHLFSLMALFSYANFRSNERVIYGDRYMEAPGQWICKLGALPRILRVHSKAQALELMEYFRNHGFLTFEILDEEKEILRFTIPDWKEHCTHLQYNYYSYKGSGFFFFPLPVGRLLLKIARKEVGIVFSELDAIMDMWLHTILNDPKVRGSEYMPVVYYSNMRGMPLLSYTYLARRWGWSKSRVGRFMLKAGEYGIISRVSFSSSRGSVISMCRYLRLNRVRDVIELPINGVLDINGWDVDKTLKLLHKSNPTVFEWFSSPIVYQTTDFTEAFKPVMRRYFSSKSGLWHYLQMAEGNYREYLRGDMVKAKKYFYVLRPILACRWILEKGTPPPMLFSELAASQLPDYLEKTVAKLLDLKMNSPEVKMIPRIDILNAYMDRSIAEVCALVEQYPREITKDWEELNALFLAALEM